MKNKAFFFLFFILTTSYTIIADESISGKSPEEYENQLTAELEASTESERRDIFLKLAEIKKISGDLKSAAEYYEKASLAVKGKKDFQALYQSALLFSETAEYRTAEAHLRAITTFSDDVSLRISAAVLNARIKTAQGMIEDAYSLLTGVIDANVKLSEEALMFAYDFYKGNNDRFDMNPLKVFIDEQKINMPYHEVKRMITPETLNLIPSTISAVQTIADEISSVEKDSSAVYIQLGSFSVKDNALDLIKELKKSGWDAVIKEKTVNNEDFFAVAVPVTDNDEVQNIIIRLKEDGYEGYPVY